ncbi:MerR family transcriptional regulator [Actinoplanes nipponensis]|nr:MerR family transcriptional regulator [Actinoplanes nipponensis]
MELLSIGELARRTGLTVKTVRFYADRGIVPPASRGPGGYRRYEPAAVARLELVRTLRELGLDLATIRRVADREVTLAEVAGTHLEALDVQIRALRLRRAVLSAAARSGSDPSEVRHLRDLARLSARERRDLIDDFLGAVFRGLDGFAGIARSLTPEPPDDPTPAQAEAWIELAGLTRDPAFRAVMRSLAERHAADRDPTALRRDPVALVLHEAGPAEAAGIDPASAGAGRVVAAVLGRFPVRERLAAQLEAARDPRHERYRQLLSVVNGWSAAEPLAPVLGWFLTALRAH